MDINKSKMSHCPFFKYFLTGNNSIPSKTWPIPVGHEGGLQYVRTYAHLTHSSLNRDVNCFGKTPPSANTPAFGNALYSSSQ